MLTIIFLGHPVYVGAAATACFTPSGRRSRAHCLLRCFLSYCIAYCLVHCIVLHCLLSGGLHCIAYCLVRRIVLHWILSETHIALDTDWCILRPKVKYCPTQNPAQWYVLCQSGSHWIQFGTMLKEYTSKALSNTLLWYVLCQSGLKSNKVAM